MNNYFQTSLSRRFASLMAVFIILFLIGASIILFIQFHVQKDYEKQNILAEDKEKIIINIDDSFNQAILDVRGYIAFGNESLKESALDEKVEIQGLIKMYSEMPLSSKEQVFLQEMISFHDLYFNELLPPTFNDYEQGNMQAIVNRANNAGTAQIQTFQRNLNRYRLELDNRVEVNSDALTSIYHKLQWTMFAFVLFMLIILLSITRISLNRIGKPLKELAFAADKVSRGDESNIVFTKDKRYDEISILKNSFIKMFNSIKENEQHMKDTNEELSEQQEELQAQQFELENLLGQMENRENQLRHHNELINSLSNSLDKQEVLNSIVKGFSGVLRADKGIIVILDSEKTYAKWGVSQVGVQQFISHLDNGTLERLQEEQHPHVIKRRLPREEKGIHNEDQPCWDLYLPVLSPSGNVEAVMVYSRFSGGYSAEEMQEYSSLSKQVSISLEKIKVFESSEADRMMNNDILNTIHEGIQLLDTNGKIIHINETFSSIYQSDHLNQYIDKSFLEWFNDVSDIVEEPVELYNFANELLTNEINAPNQAQYKLINGQPRMIQVYAEPLYRNETLTGWILVHRDFTKEYEADQMKNELVSTVSHELRTPLASVLGYTELLINRELKPERQKKYLNTIYQEANRLTVLINDFLDVQRMESGKQTYEKKYESLTPLLKEVIEGIKINTSIHDIQFVSDADDDMVLGDRDKLLQVFQNLIQNAVKYSPAGGNITIKLHSAPKELHVSIIDEGLGVPEEAMPNLFTKFFRVDNSDRRKIGGTGLGLAIAKEIIKAHEGDIVLSSKLGQGSTFTVILPKVKGIAEITTESYSGKGRGKIVIVEDDKQLASLLSNELTESGFFITTFSNGEEALAYVEKNPPDAIILDIMLSMSNMDGLDVLQTVKNHSELKDIPVFVSTALDEKEKVLKLGAEGFLVKPYSPSKLTELVLNNLNG
ncbi:ATP-binding protein [Bacillus sp. SG-1]|uniref:ATP-binding protein n=1 Tax=Bacillus sp. SG-1 TaxID=161544 RepID=UPI000154482A|nr:ATP-binding protein [Bacillus sp. SG-1]EDL62754.1 two-component hybrid sensor and regulator [Bacillus sp. SG-1]